MVNYFIADLKRSHHHYRQVHHLDLVTQVLNDVLEDDVGSGIS